MSNEGPKNPWHAYQEKIDSWLALEKMRNKVYRLMISLFIAGFILGALIF